MLCNYIIFNKLTKINLLILKIRCQMILHYQIYEFQFTLFFYLLNSILKILYMLCLNIKLCFNYYFYIKLIILQIFK